MPAARPPARRKATGLRRRARSERWWPALVVLVPLLLLAAWAAEDGPAGDSPPTAVCTMPHSSLTVSAEQVRNAEVIAEVARERQLPDRAIVIALATAQQESRLRNLDYGDRDSLGLFQQRPSQGWGTAAQVQDPAYAAGEFYERLVRVPRRETRRLTDVAQAVQRSAYPDLYQQWEPLAGALTRALDGDGGMTLRCD